MKTAESAPQKPPVEFPTRFWVTILVNVFVVLPHFWKFFSVLTLPSLATRALAYIVLLAYFKRAVSRFVYGDAAQAAPSAHAGAARAHQYEERVKELYVALYTHINHALSFLRRVVLVEDWWTTLTVFAYVLAARFAATILGETACTLVLVNVLLFWPEVSTLWRKIDFPKTAQRILLTVDAFIPKYSQKNL